MRRPLAWLALAAVLTGCAAPAAAPLEAAPGAASLSSLPPSPVAANAWRDREADAAFDPTDPAHVVVFYNERPEAYLTGAVLTDPITPGKLRMALASSRDGGGTWSVQRVPLAGTAPVGSAWAAFCAMGDPNVFFDGEGLVHVVLLAFTCGGPGLTVVDVVAHATTSDGGATWSEPHLVALGAGGPAGLFHDRPWAAIDPVTGRIGVAWTSINLNRAALTVAFSEDGGRTWTLPRELEVLAPITEVANYLLHTTWGPDERFHVAGVGCGGGCFVHFALEPDGEPERTEAPLCAGVDAPLEYAVSAWSGGALVVAGAPLANAGATCVVASDDGGATWTRELTLPAMTHPALAPAPGGLLLAALAMAGEEATPTLVRLDAGLAETARLALGERYRADTDGDGAPEAGDYDSLAVSTDGAAVWALTRPNGEGRPSAGDAFHDLDVWAYRGQVG